MKFHNKQLLDYALFAFERKELISVSIEYRKKYDTYILYLNCSCFLSSITYNDKQSALDDYMLLKKSLVEKGANIPIIGPHTLNVYKIKY